MNVERKTPTAFVCVFNVAVGVYLLNVSSLHPHTLSIKTNNNWWGLSFSSSTHVPHQLYLFLIRECVGLRQDFSRRRVFTPSHSSSQSSTTLSERKTQMWSRLRGRMGWWETVRKGKHRSLIASVFYFVVAINDQCFPLSRLRQHCSWLANPLNRNEPTIVCFLHARFYSRDWVGHESVDKTQRFKEDSRHTKVIKDANRNVQICASLISLLGGIFLPLCQHATFSPLVLVIRFLLGFIVDDKDKGEGGVLRYLQAQQAC